MFNKGDLITLELLMRSGNTLVIPDVVEWKATSSVDGGFKSLTIHQSDNTKRLVPVPLIDIRRIEALVEMKE